MAAPKIALAAWLPNHRHLVDSTHRRLLRHGRLRNLSCYSKFNGAPHPVALSQPLQLLIGVLGPDEPLSHRRGIIALDADRVFAVDRQGHLIFGLSHIRSPPSVQISLSKRFPSPWAVLL